MGARLTFVVVFKEDTYWIEAQDERHQAVYAAGPFVTLRQAEDNVKARNARYGDQFNQAKTLSEFVID